MMEQLHILIIVAVTESFWIIRRVLLVEEVICEKRNNFLKVVDIAKRCTNLERKDFS